MSILVEELKKAELAKRKNPMAGRAEVRATVQNLFPAKQVERSPPRRNRIFAVAAVIMLFAAAGGIYFWVPVKFSAGSEAAAPIGGTQQPPVEAAMPIVASPSAEKSAVAVPPSPPSPATHVEAAPKQPVAATSPPVAPTKSVQGEAAGQIRISAARPGLNPGLTRGYEAYMAGKLSIAHSEYQQVLISEPKNSDALVALAAISLRQGEPDAAEEYYLRVIEANPRDAMAQVGLIGIRGQREPLQAESRLKTLLAAQPELSFLNIALGNLYAAQNRWTEAQQSFFKAYVVEPDNPDTLFSLAVSLDHMGQSLHALKYYKQALDAAEKHLASFDKLQVSARLRELQH